MKIDSGSGMNTIAQNVWPAIKRGFDEGSFRLYNLRSNADSGLTAYGNNKLEVIAQFEAEIAIVGHQSNPLRLPRVETVTVCQNTTVSLMSRQTAEYFKLLKVGPLEIDSLTEPGHFPIVPNFVVKFDIDHNAPGHVDMTLRIPLAQRREQMRVLANYKDLGIIEPVPPMENPKFVSPQFFVKKANGTLRLVNDNKEVNKAIRLVNHSMPTLESFLPDFAGHDTFSTLDIKDAFLHLPLDEEARKMTTFNTPAGLYRYTRLSFGNVTAPTIFQLFMDMHFKQMEGVHVFMDDVAISGKGNDECRNRTDAVLEKIKTLNLTLNLEKCKFCEPEVIFLGMRLNRDGIHPTVGKLEALKAMRPPKKLNELRGFLGLLTFFNTFIPNLQEKTKEMKKLLKASAEFVWTSAMQSEFEAAKTLLKENATRAHFDQHAPKTYIYTDASQDSLGAVMTQEDENGTEKIVMCASRSTTPAESNYGQDGLEAKAVAWIFPKWMHYTLGRYIILRSDASALKYIFNNASNKKREMSRASVFALTLSSFNFHLEYVPGKKNPADPFSRLTVTTADSWTPEVELFHVQAADLQWKKSISFDDVRERTGSCNELRLVFRALETKLWDRSVIAYKHFDNELANLDGLLVRGSRIVPPVAMRKELLEDAHELHPGIVTMKRFLRQRAWWPGMDGDIERLVKSCYACILNSPPNPPIPQQISLAPEQPWEMIAIDLHSHQPTKLDAEQSPFDRACKNPGGSKRNLLVIIDIYSRFIRAFPVTKTDTGTIIALLALTFSFYGNPSYVKSDNGPPFNSAGYATFLENRGIEAIHSTPLWPQMNSHVERAMSTINNRLRKGSVEDKDWEESIMEFNSRYNEWPHSSTRVSPFMMLFRREPRLALPSIVGSEPVDEHISDQERRLKMERKLMTDKKRRAILSPITEGDLVVMLTDTADKKKMGTTYADEVWKVLMRTGCEVIVQSQADLSKTRKRNVNFCKLLPQNGESPQLEETIVVQRSEVQQDEPNMPTIHAGAAAPIPGPSGQRMDGRLRNNIKETKRYIELCNIDKL